MTESKIEKACSKWAESAGWQVFKFVSPGQRGVPDKVFLKSGKTVFVEFKQPGGKLSTLQKVQIEKLKANDFKVFIIDSLEGFKIAFSR
tara:strand:- start:174 stop:440 length:267 start_codon:yes stop_codon:yes gene_type:complete